MRSQPAPFEVRHNLRYAIAMSAIRLAGPADHAAIVALVHEAYAVYVPRIGRPPAPMLEDYQALIRDARVHVLEDETGIAGIVVLIPEERVMLLDNVAVKGAAQGRGYGRTLIAFAEATARAAGYRTIRLFTHERMTENIARYPRLGYVETHRNEEEGLRRVHFTKQLGAVP
jgi:N-acetylglutamate synthase-like GNAT family acetyltransferase